MEGLNKSPLCLRYTAYRLPNPQKPAVFRPLTQGAIAAPGLFRGSLVGEAIASRGTLPWPNPCFFFVWPSRSILLPFERTFDR